MITPSPEQDLVLKRLITDTSEQKPRFDWRQSLNGYEEKQPSAKIVSNQGERDFDLGDVADAVGMALTHLLLAREENDIFTEENRQFVSRIAYDVARALTSYTEDRPAPARLDVGELYSIIERALVENRAYDVAKSLVLKRSSELRAPTGANTGLPRLIRRNNQIVPWNEAKIEVAVRKSFLSLEKDSAPAAAIARAITERVRLLNQEYIHIEEVQDLVQEELMRAGHFKVAENYILYRARRAALREADETEIPAPEQGSMVVVRNPEDGATWFWDGLDLRLRIQFATIGLELSLTQDEIETELRRSLFDEISPADLKNTIILNARTLIERDSGFAKFAGRILLTYIYEEVLEWDITRQGIGGLKEAHQNYFAKYLHRGVEIGRLDKRLLEYDIEQLAAAIDPSADLGFDYLGIQTLYDRYLVTDKTGKKHRRIETPQIFWLRVAMGLFIKEESDREDRVTELYDLYKSRRFCSSTPTLFNAGTPHSQLSSCYLYWVDDSIEGIMQRGIADNAYLSKWAGGLGGSWTSVRGTGAHINGTNGESQGVIPFLKLHNDQLIAVNQGGKRRGSGCAYLETWHNDLLDFLELRRNTGDDRRRCHDMNTANWIPDLFMKRMENREDWTFFRSNEVSDLHHLYGKKFEEKYLEYEARAERGEIMAKKVPAIDVWKKMLQMIFETGHPWMTFKDTCNVRSPQDHAGVIHSSNLCCMTADQRVVTSEGLVTVGELYARAHKQALVGTDGNSVMSEEPVNTVFGRSGAVPAGPMLLPRPDAPIVRIVTKEGYSHKVTPDHKVWVVNRGWVEAQELQRGARIEIQQAEGLWGSLEAEDEAFLCGLIAGDGTYMVREGTTSVLIDLWTQEFSLISEVEERVARLLTESPVRTTSTRNPRFAGDEYKKRLASAPLARLLAELGFTRETKLKVPEFVWKGTRDTVAAYLRGLYAADATVESSGEVTTCGLASADQSFLADIQVLLANFGMKSSLTKMREGGLTELPDGRGGVREYYQRELWRLHVTSIQGCRILENLTGIGALRNNAQYLANLEKPGYAQKMHATFEALEIMPNEDAFCLQVFTEEHSWTVNALITKNTEITLNTGPDETAVCNLGSVILDNHLDENGEILHDKLRETIRIAVRALDNVIDINFYPTEAAKNANMRHRPVGLGVMGLQNALYQRGAPFASPEAVEFNDEFMEAIAYYAYEASSDLAGERGAYSTFKGSKWDRGILPQDTVDLLAAERGEDIDVPRGGKMDWTPVREKIAKQGMRNSNVLAIAPTATISNITGTSPCIEPAYKNLFVKSNLSGEFIILNAHLVRDLKAEGLWNQEMIDNLKYFDGDLSDIESIPDHIKARYQTAFDIDHTWFVEAAARRQKWIDQAQSVNLFLKSPDIKTLSHMYRAAWRKGLKTTYYLRTLGASNIEKATVSVKKEVRGTVNGDKPTYTEEEKRACSIEALRNGEECEACQ